MCLSPRSGDPACAPGSTQPDPPTRSGRSREPEPSVQTGRSGQPKRPVRTGGPGRSGRGLSRRGLLVPLLLGGVAVGAIPAHALSNPSAPGAPGSQNGLIRQRGNSFLIRNVRVFDGERVLDRTHVLVIRGRIAALGDDTEPAAAHRGLSAYDGRGHTLLPGLVDAHVHSDAQLRRDALRFGVTTELVMFGDPGEIAGARRRRDSFRRTRQADLWSAGIGVTVPGGHPNVDGWEYPRLADGMDPDRFVADRIREGSDFIKIIIESGGQPPAPSLPTLCPEQVRAAVAAAHQRGRLAVAHAERTEHVRTAIEAGVDGLVHVALDAVLDDDLVRAIRRAQAFVVPTVPVIDCGRSADDLLADPRVAPYLSSAQTALLQARRPRCTPDWRDRALANTKRLFEAGVPIIAGTDAPLPGTADGPSLLAEIGYLVEAGLTSTQALAAATSVPAAAFGLPRRGRVRPGYRADLILVQGDPTGDSTAVRDIAAVWKNGYCIDRTPTNQAPAGESTTGGS